MAFLNLCGANAEPQISEDRDAFGNLFTSEVAQDTDTPDCDVLMIYCELGPDGSVSGDARRLRDIIGLSGASVAVVASENSGEAYLAGARRDGHARVNLVMTLDRKGNDFGNFFRELFRRMFQGQSMLIAWTELAPQVPGAAHEGVPETIFAAEISHIIFDAE